MDLFASFPICGGVAAGFFWLVLEVIGRFSLVDLLVKFPRETFVVDSPRLERDFGDRRRDC